MTASASSVPAPVPRGWLAEWLAGWNAFWFAPADPLPLAMVRICTGVLLAWSAVVWLLDAPAFFAADAWLRPEDVWRMNDQPWQWSWYFWAGTPTAARLLALVTLGAAVCLALGLLTPVAALVSLLGLVSAANRTPLTTFGLDDTLGMLLVPLVVGPSGAVLSLDALLGWGDPRPGVRANVALRLLQVHLCVVYLFSGCGKLLGASWWEGTALWGAIANVQYRTLDLTGLARHPLVVNALTLATLFWEVGYAALVWPRLTRPLILAMAAPVHLGIGLAMGMMEFGLAMLTANLAFVSPGTFRAMVSTVSTRSPDPSEGLA
ncbi:MAG: HTTM domain-containing protein [Planctomycetia bacterium]|nr:HTTM domain-containing protein [Planctomycetia bacterium]